MESRTLTCEGQLVAAAEVGETYGYDTGKFDNVFLFKKDRGYELLVVGRRERYAENGSLDRAVPFEDERIGTPEEMAFSEELIDLVSETVRTGGCLESKRPPDPALPSARRPHPDPGRAAEGRSPGAVERRSSGPRPTWPRRWPEPSGRAPAGTPAAKTSKEADADEPLAYSVEEAACLLGISRTKAYECVRTGQLRTIQLNRRLLVPAVAIDELLGQKELRIRHRTAGRPVEEGMNRVELVGWLTRDGELRPTRTGSSICPLRVAIRRRHGANAIFVEVVVLGEGPGAHRS